MFAVVVAVTRNGVPAVVITYPLPKETVPDSEPIVMPPPLPAIVLPFVVASVN